MIEHAGENLQNIGMNGAGRSELQHRFAIAENLGVAEDRAHPHARRKPLVEAAPRHAERCMRSEHDDAANHLTGKAAGLQRGHDLAPVAGLVDHRQFTAADRFLDPLIDPDRAERQRPRGQFDMTREVDFWLRPGDDPRDAGMVAVVHPDLGWQFEEIGITEIADFMVDPAQHVTHQKLALGRARIEFVNAEVAENAEREPAQHALGIGRGQLPHLVAAVHVT